MMERPSSPAPRMRIDAVRGGGGKDIVWRGGGVKESSRSPVNWIVLVAGPSRTVARRTNLIPERKTC